jgi:hypothetical protein
MGSQCNQNIPQAFALKLKLAIEILLLYVVPPMLVWFGVVHLYALAGVVGGVVAILVYRSRGKGVPHCASVPERTEMDQFRHVLARFAVSAALLVAGLCIFDHDALFAFPRARPRLWLTVMILYPLISACLQEIMYRHLFFRRYAFLVRGGRSLILLNSLLFAWLHVFLTPIAVVLSVPAGWFFADTYLRSRSFRLTWFEHALYGDFVFTIGLGMYFYHGA